MAFPHPDDDAPPITAGEWGLLTLTAICILFAIAVMIQRLIEKCRAQNLPAQLRQSIQFIGEVQVNVFQKLCGGQGFRQFRPAREALLQRQGQR